MKNNNGAPTKSDFKNQKKRRRREEEEEEEWQQQDQLWRMWGGRRTEGGKPKNGEKVRLTDLRT